MTDLQARHAGPSPARDASSRATARSPTPHATAEVLHALLERAGTLGVLGLDDLLALPTDPAHPSSEQASPHRAHPRARPGVYRFRDRNGRVIYVGRATNLRARVRAHFHGDLRRKVPQLLHETESIEWIELPDVLEASVTEARLIRELDPRFNRPPGRKKRRKQPVRPRATVGGTRYGVMSRRGIRPGQRGAGRTAR